jgi:hypothetical protein
MWKYCADDYQPRPAVLYAIQELMEWVQMVTPGEMASRRTLDLVEIEEDGINNQHFFH